MTLVEVVGPDPRRRNVQVVYYRTVIEGDVDSQRDAWDRLGEVLLDDWRVIYRPLGSLDGIVRALGERKAARYLKTPG